MAFSKRRCLLPSVRLSPSPVSMRGVAFTVIFHTLLIRTPATGLTVTLTTRPHHNSILPTVVQFQRRQILRVRMPGCLSGVHNPTQVRQSQECPVRSPSQYIGGTSLAFTLSLYSCREEVCPPGGLPRPSHSGSLTVNHGPLGVNCL